MGSYGDWWPAFLVSIKVGRSLVVDCDQKYRFSDEGYRFQFIAGKHEVGVDDQRIGRLRCSGTTSRSLHIPLLPGYRYFRKSFQLVFDFLINIVQVYPKKVADGGAFEKIKGCD
jgi:hypothetical protein